MGGTIGYAGGGWEGALRGAQMSQMVGSAALMNRSLRNHLLAACFEAGTPLLTVDGSKPIEQFRTGDKVLAKPEFNPEGPVQERLWAGLGQVG